MDHPPFLSITAVQREALLERAAILEYDAGLDRKTATLTACKLYFPQTYQAMKKTANAYPDGMTALYEFIEGELLKSPEMAIEEPTVSVETKKVVIHGNAPESPPMPRYEGLQALQYMTAHSIPVIGVYESGATIAGGESRTAAFTIDLKEIVSLMEGKGDREGRARGTPITRFYFIPKNAGLLCLDFDCKNGKDGIAEFYQWTATQGRPRKRLPTILQDIPFSFPCWVSTPSGGCHLYFKYTGVPPIHKISPACEIMFGSPGLTAPGSYKNSKPYVLNGKIEDAPDLPVCISHPLLLQIPKPEPKKRKRKKSENKTTWTQILGYTDKDRRGTAGRDEYAYSIAFHAATHGWTQSDTEQEMLGMSWHFDHSFTKIALTKCIKSAYQRAEGGKV